MDTQYGKKYGIRVMKLISDGKDLFAIKKGWWIFSKYFDLQTPGFWWRKDQSYFTNCWGSKEKAEAWLRILKAN
jgi:hypothetical protein